MGALSKILSREMLISSFKSLIKTKTRRVSTILTIAIILGLVAFRKKERTKQAEKLIKKKKRSKGSVDALFFKKLMTLLKIAIPSFGEPIIIDFILLNISLVIRTILSINISTQNGMIVKSIIQIDFNSFLKNLGTLGLYAIPASFINSLLEYLNNKIALTIRYNLNTYFHNEYIDKNIVYQVSTIDSRLPNPDQRLTEDVAKWAMSISNLYSNFSKPLLDIILFTKKLSELVGWTGPLMLIVWYMFSAVILRIISPPFGKLMAKQQKLDGRFRAAHTKITHHSEEIAFYRGEKWELKMTNKVFDDLYKHTKVVAINRLFMGVYDSMLVKYGAVVVAFFVLGIPTFGSSKEDYLRSVGNDTSSITRDYIRNSNLLISLAKAIARIIISYKEVQNLAGFTSLVYDMSEVITELKSGVYHRVKIEGQISENPEAPNKHKLMGGELNIADEIRYFDVLLNAPNGDVLLNAPIRFIIKPGMNCLFIGPNGCGKSSLFRILMQLWPLQSGQLTRPNANNIFFLPEKPYLPPGTLRDQITYPDLQSKMSDKELRELMSFVDLDHLYKREKKYGGFESVKPWVDVLSGGERQKISFARIFYHKPLFAVLDDSTSAVSMDFEHILYKKCKELKITMFTVSQRNTLYPFHDYLLKFDGEKGWSFEKIVHHKDEDSIAYNQI